MTLGQMVTDVKARCGINDSSLDAAIKVWINAGQQNIASRYTWQFLFQEDSFNTVADDDTYGLGTDVMNIYMMRNTTSNKVMRFRTNRDFFHEVPAPVATGYPYIYRIIGATQDGYNLPATNQVVLYPIPDDVYTIKYSYYMRLSDLAGDEAVSLIPVQFHELMVFYACNLYFEREGDPRAVTNYDKYENGLSNMADQLSTQPVDHIDGLQGNVSEGPFVRFPSNYSNNGEW